MTQPSRRNLIRLAMLLALSLAVFLPFIGSRDIATSHEARVVQVARQMADVGWPWNAKLIEVPQVTLQQTAQGLRLRAKPGAPTMWVNPWLVPVMNGRIRIQKPPLPYWCSAVLFRVFGFGEGVSRFIPALLGAVAVLLVWDLARLLIGRIGAWYAAMVWVSTFFIVDEFRKTMADPYLAFFTLSATWAWVRATVSPVPFSPGHGPDSMKRATFLFCFYTSLALGVLAKGPLIFVFVAVYLVLYHILYRKRLPGSPLHHLAFFAFFAAISLIWFYLVYRTLPNAIELWRYESIGELSDNVEKARGWWFYLPNLLLIALPWTPVWLLGLFNRSTRSRRRRVFAIAGTIVVVLMFSVSNVKKNAYLLPLMPIQTVVIAQGLLALTVMFRRDPRSRPVRVPLRRTMALAVIFVVGIQIMESVVLTRTDDNRSAKDACRLVARLIDESPATSVLVSGMPEEATVYLRPDLRDSTTSEQVLVILDDRKGKATAAAKEISSTPSGSVMGMEEVPISGARGERWKVFKLKIVRPIPATEPTTSP